MSSQSADNDWISTTVGGGAVYDDINGDRIVNYDDYGILIQNWGEGCL